MHPEGRVDPLADAETIETELLFADLEQAERRLERVSKQAKSGDKVAVAEERWLQQVVDALREGRAVRTVPDPEDAPGAATRLTALTSKPVLYVANVAEGEPLEPPPALVAHAEERGARATAVSARLDSELSELDDEEADAMRDEMGMGESGLETVIREAFSLLDLIQFFTAGQDKEAPRLGDPARHARPRRGRLDPHGHGAGLRGRGDHALGRPRRGGRLQRRPRARPDPRGGPRLPDAGRRRGDLPLHAELR